MEFKPEGFGSFNFRRADPPSPASAAGGLRMVLNGQAMLGGSSNLVIAPELPVNAAAPQPRLASLLVEVTDLNQQTLSRRVEFVRHSSDFYLGLRQGAEVLKAGEALPLEVVAVRADGQPWPETVKAQLTLQRIDWQPVRIQGAGKTIRYRNEAVVTNVLEQRDRGAANPDADRARRRGQRQPDSRLAGPARRPLSCRGQSQGCQRPRGDQLAGLRCVGPGGDRLELSQRRAAHAQARPQVVCAG